MPLWQLCHLCQLNVEESLSTPELPISVRRKSKPVVSGEEPDPADVDAFAKPFDDLPALVDS
jgi:hypothetical protein